MTRAARSFATDERDFAAASNSAAITGSILMAGTPALFEPLRHHPRQSDCGVADVPVQRRERRAAVSACPPGTVALRSADTVPTGAGTPLNSDPTRRDDGPQPVADLGSATNRIHDLARNPIAPNQVAGRLGIQSAIIGGDRDDLGR